MFPGGYMPFQYGDGKSLIEASVIMIIMMKNDKDNTAILSEKELYILYA